MDTVGVDSVDPSGKGSENLVSLVGDKRMADCDEGENLGVKKKARVVDSSGDMKRIAEIVLVLSMTGKMRGGRNPTDFEKVLMAEAREKLTTSCEDFSPQDIIPKDAVRVVIEDLGLNKLTEQRPGLRPPPKMSIAEKFLLAKRKMEKSKKFAAQSATYSSQSHRTMLHTAQKSPAKKPSPSTVSVGGSQAASPVVHVTALAATSSWNQLPANKVQSATVSRGLLGNDSRNNSSSHFPRTEGAPFRLDGRSNGSVYGSVQANSSGNHLLEKAPMFAPQSSAVGKVGQANKTPDHTIKVEETPDVSTSKVALQVMRDQNSKPSMIQNAHGNLNVHHLSQPSNYLQSYLVSSNHNDIAKNVQKLLQPRLPEHPNWTPPSTDYMNKSLTCQICKVTINDVESLLVCDACEKGVHLKCLQSCNQKGIPKGEWHCPKCLISSNGKPLPPKYGRVTRNITAQRVSANTGRIQASPEKVENPNQKVNPQMITANGNSGGQSLAYVGSTGSDNSGSATDLKASNSNECLGGNISSSRKKMDEEPPSEVRSVPKETTGVCGPSGKPNDSSIQHLQNSESSPFQPEASINEIKSPPNVQSGPSGPDKPSNPSIDTCNNAKATFKTQDVDKAECPSNTEASANEYYKVKASGLRDTFERNPGCGVRQDDKDVAQIVSVGTSDVGNGTRNCTRSSSDGMQRVDWVGDILQVVDEKAFYKCCHINGIVYKLQDHALFSSNNDNLRPSKLQALWEDTKTGSKWAVVNRCYLPDDLPQVPGRPCTPENNEVYESNHGSTMRATLIQGPCEVLFPNKFKEECERRTLLEHGTNNGLQPLFLCKWFYDESKGQFRAVTD